MLPSYQNTPERAAAVAASAAKIVPGRACGPCTMCCKVLAIPELAKPAGQWCPHTKSKEGCGVYEVRPFSCRAFYCEWMVSKGLGPEWKPDRAKFVLFTSENGARLTAHLDPGFPGAWRREPYFTNFKRWAVKAAQQRPMHLVDVMMRDNVTVVLPDREVELGVVGSDEMVRLDLNGETIAVRVVKRPGMQPASARVS